MNEFLIYDRTRNDLLLSVTQTFFFQTVSVDRTKRKEIRRWR